VKFSKALSSPAANPASAPFPTNKKYAGFVLIFKNVPNHLAALSDKVSDSVAGKASRTVASQSFQNANELN